MASKPQSVSGKYVPISRLLFAAYSDYSWDEMRSRLDKPDSLVILKKPFDNVEVQQMAHAMTKKWLLSHRPNCNSPNWSAWSPSARGILQTANESLSLSERFSKAFHGNPVPSAIQSLSDQRFLDVNQCLADIAGCKREEMIGRTPAELFLWEKPEVADQWWKIYCAMKPSAIRAKSAPKPAPCMSIGVVSAVTLAKRTAHAVAGSGCGRAFYWSDSCVRPRRWRPLVSWRLASPTISTTFSR